MGSGSSVTSYGTNEDHGDVFALPAHLAGFDDSPVSYPHGLLHT